MIPDPIEESLEMAWGDNFIMIRGVRYSKRETYHTRCNTCEAHTDQIIYQNLDDEGYIHLCSCWTDSIYDRNPRAVTQVK